MQLKLAYTWNQARSNTFNKDSVRTNGHAFRAKKKSCFISKKNETDVAQIKEWLRDNEIIAYAMFGVFIVHPDDVYYHGLMFEFKDEDDLIFFKLRFQ